MRLKFTSFLTFFMALVLFKSEASAAAYPVYLCGGGAVTLSPGSITINPADQVIWVEVFSDNTTNTVKTGSGTDKNFTTPADISVGEHVYRVHIISASPANCQGDPSDDYKIYVLPDIQIALTDPTADRYCTNASVTSSKITASPSSTVPSEVLYEYVWVINEGSTSIIPTAVGTITTSADTRSSEFQLTTTNVGTYKIVAKLNYKVPAASVLKSGDNAGCVNTSIEKSIVVEPKPAKPVITFI